MGSCQLQCAASPRFPARHGLLPGAVVQRAWLRTRAWHISWRHQERDAQRGFAGEDGSARDDGADTGA